MAAAVSLPNNSLCCFTNFAAGAHPAAAVLLLCCRLRGEVQVAASATMMGMDMCHVAACRPVAPPLGRGADSVDAIYGLMGDIWLDG